MLMRRPPANSRMPTGSVGSRARGRDVCGSRPRHPRQQARTRRPARCRHQRNHRHRRGSCPAAAAAAAARTTPTGRRGIDPFQPRHVADRLSGDGVLRSPRQSLLTPAASAPHSRRRRGSPDRQRPDHRVGVRTGPTPGSGRPGRPGDGAQPAAGPPRPDGPTVINPVAATLRIRARLGATSLRQTRIGGRR